MAAKVSFTKFNKKEDVPVTLVEHEGVKFGVKSQLGSKELMNFEEELLNLLINDPFYNETKFNVYFDILYVKYISTISFTEAQITKSIYQTYDIITKPQGLLSTIITEGHCESDYWNTRTAAQEVVQNFFKFKTTFLGTMITMNNQQTLGLDIDKLLNEIKSPEVKEILEGLKNTDSNVINFPSVEE